MRVYPWAGETRTEPLAGKGSPPWPRPALREREIGTISAPETTHSPSSALKTLWRPPSASLFRRACLAWLSLELGAGILALCLLVAVLPLFPILLPRVYGSHAAVWIVAVDVLSISVPLAVLLGVLAMRLPREVVVLR